MKLIDVDKIKAMESHIHYIKIYQGSAIFLDNNAKICRHDIKFSIEYKPIGEPDIKIHFLDKSEFHSNDTIMEKIKKKISELDNKGILSEVLKNSK
jgi:hypothetical protein